MMNKQIRLSIFNLFFCVGRFGIWKGFKTWFYLYIFEKKIIYLPFVKHPIFLRPNTTDAQVFFDVFIKQQYGFPIGFEPLVIIDAGANIGLSSIYFSNLYPLAKIYSIEIEDNNYELLVKNTSCYNNVIPIKAALWFQEAIFSVSDNKNGNWGFTVEKIDTHKAIQTVKSITMEQMMSRYPLNTIDILKIDIEGAEKELFSDNFVSWLPKTRVIMIEPHDRIKRGCSKSILTAINQFDFSLEIRGELLIFINNNFQ